MDHQPPIALNNNNNGKTKKKKKRIKATSFLLLALGISVFFQLPVLSRSMRASTNSLGGHIDLHAFAPPVVVVQSTRNNNNNNKVMSDGKVSAIMVTTTRNETTIKTTQQKKISGKTVTISMNKVNTRMGKRIVYTSTNSSMNILENNNSNNNSKRKWAYAFVMGGIGKPYSEYRGFLYNILVSAELLKQMGSQADVVVLVQMSCESTATSLPQDQVQALQTLGVKIHYLPKLAAPIHETFYTLMMEKFRILTLTEYSRVLFMDSDVMPRCNLDYLFQWSDPPPGQKATLKENVILAWKTEPANGGFFLLEPNLEHYQEISQIIQQREKQVLTLPFPYFDEVQGWGHAIQPDDEWRTMVHEIGTNWSFHGSWADQGLLFHWTKYVRKSVSIINMRAVEHWGSSSSTKNNNNNGTLVLQSRISNELEPNSNNNNYTCKTIASKNLYFYPPPYRDFIHFTGLRKPWLKPSTELEKHLQKAIENNKTFPAILLWYDTLKRINSRLSLPLPLDFMGDEHPPVGSWPKAQSLLRHVEAKARNQWNHYAKV